MMPRPLRKQFILHARKPQFQRRVTQALDVICAFLAIPQTPYIAVSGGKDSSVMLHLCRYIQPDLDAINIIFHTHYPETLEYLKTYDNLKCYDAGDRLKMLEQVGIDDSKATFGKIRNFDGDTVRSHGYDGFFYGLRAEESSKRRKLLGVRGQIFYRKTDDLWVCQPLAHFSYNDVWAYIIANDLPYNALYDLMWDRPIHQQRVAEYSLVKEMERGSSPPTSK